MKRLIPMIIVIGLVLSSACAPTAAPPTPTPTPVPQVSGKTIVVNRTADSGSGTLRQALLDAQSGDTLTFDPAVFRPDAPATIYVSSELPLISQGNLTIDASNAGVILDGSNISEDFMPCLQIISDGNTVQGLQIVNFSPGAGIILSGGAQNNMVGGDRSIGSGPLGQGNLTSSGDIGIGLWGDGTSFNTVTGNLIGTDTSGADARGNSSSGIYISEGACHNTIGPYNIVAYNQDGITIRDSNSLGNTVTRNSIYDNEHQGIDVFEGANIELSTPLIIDFDLAAGTVAGTACANCTIEIFSDSSNEGEVYEGQTTASGTGVFAFDKGASFTGAHLAATATDADGNTSEFSAPTLGTSRYVILQEGNNLPRIQFRHKQSRELEDNRVGDMITLHPQFQTEDPDDFANRINEKGLKWMRLSIDVFDWIEVENTGAYSEFSVYPEQDKAITGLVDNHIKVMYTLVFWDEAIQVEGEDYSRFKTEDEIQRYLDYVKFIVDHFKDRIEYYEILNEPNIGEGTQQYVETADYINLVRRAIPIIRQEYPEAKIVVGAITPLYCIEDIIRIEPGAREYLFGILESDIMPLVDAVSWHAMGGASPEYGEEYYYDYPSLLQEIKSVASAHGFQGEYIAEELHWRTPRSPHPHEYSEYGEIAAAKYLARGIVMHLGMNVATGLAETLENPAKMSVIQSLSTIMAGAEPVSLPVEIQSEATNIKSYGFSLPNGDKLLALWTDGIAINDDPGVTATLTVPGVSAQRVMGIDILKGFEQQMVTNTEGGNLVIRNLLVKDYPIILRFMP